QTTLLGIESDRPVSGQELSFEKDDRIFLFTDGVIETADPLGEAYGGGHLEDFISKHHSMSPSDFHKSLLEDLSRHNRGIFKDDVFLLSIRIR
ncbi:MAG TPA: PP2C family protein-serine/threonine phosphatase, partial [bacterium]|nr:PP2C family protein-serine/threonine phosphatase [bacterium]